MNSRTSKGNQSAFFGILLLQRITSLLRTINMMIIRELVEEERDKAAAFLLALDEHDRYWRFCRPMTDDAVRAYAERIDWQSTTIIAAFDAQAQLAGILELCDNGAAAEIAVAVARPYRGHRVGRALMDRALLKAKVQGKECVTLTCLVENEPMRRLARGAGLAAAQAVGGEVEAAQELENARPEELAEHATTELMGSMTYAGAL
jgi:GNAT superfamily N-acetyltransferase